MSSNHNLRCSVTIGFLRVEADVGIVFPLVFGVPFDVLRKSSFFQQAFSVELLQHVDSYWDKVLLIMLAMHKMYLSAHGTEV